MLCPTFMQEKRLLLPLHCERFRALRCGSFAHAHDRNCVCNIGGAAWLTIKHLGGYSPQSPPLPVLTPMSLSALPPPTFTLYVFLCRASTRECTTLATPGSHLVRWWDGISGSRYVQECHGLSRDVPGYHMHLYICIQYYTHHLPRSLRREPSLLPIKRGWSLTMHSAPPPFTDGEGLWLLLRRGKLVVR